MPRQPTPTALPVVCPDPTLDPIVRVFQPRVAEPISRDRAATMRHNLFGFVRELLDWRRQDEAAARAAGGAE